MKQKTKKHLKQRNIRAQRKNHLKMPLHNMKTWNTKRHTALRTPQHTALGCPVFPHCLAIYLTKLTLPTGFPALFLTVSLPAWARFSASFRRCLFCSLCLHSLRLAATCPELHLCLTEFSENSAFPVNPSSRCLSARAAASPALWHQEQLKTSAIAE